MTNVNLVIEHRTNEALKKASFQYDMDYGVDEEVLLEEIGKEQGLVGEDLENFVNEVSLNEYKVTLAEVELFGELSDLNESENEGHLIGIVKDLMNQDDDVESFLTNLEERLDLLKDAVENYSIELLLSLIEHYDNDITNCAEILSRQELTVFHNVWNEDQLGETYVEEIGSWGGVDFYDNKDILHYLDYGKIGAELTMSGYIIDFEREYAYCIY